MTFATRLALAGVSLVQAQELMLHSDPKLTANIYTQLRLEEAHDAVVKIDIGGGAPPHLRLAPPRGWGPVIGL